MTPVPPVVRILLLVGMAIFLVTIGIGILNGLDLVTFSRDALLAHVHSGTLGWITLGVVAIAALTLGGLDPRLAGALALATPVYVLAFLSGNYPARAVTGVVMLVLIVVLIAWTWQRFRAGRRTLAELALALGLTTFTYGSIIGVLLQIQFATGSTLLSGDAIAAHASAMVFSYLILVATGVIEARLRGTSAIDRASAVQLVALFVGGLALSLGLIVGASQAAGGIALLFNLVAVVIFAIRVGPSAARTAWLEAGPRRHFAAAAAWVVVAMGIFMYLVAQFVAAKGDSSAISPNTLVASDHSSFIGVMTNLLFGVIAGLSGARARPGWVDHFVFWGLNLGLAVFVVGLVGNSALVKEIGSPIMGLAALAAIAVFGTRLAWSPIESAEAA